MRCPPVASVSFLLLSVVLVGNANAQLSRGGTPASFASGGTFGAFAGEIPIELLPAPDIERLRFEDEINGPFPYRYGDMIETSIGLGEHGRWDETAGGAIVWRVEISSPGAYSLGVLFDEFDLPPTGELFLYDPQQKQVLGAYTEANEQENGRLAIEPVHGDRLIIEYVQQPGNVEAPRLRVGSVVHDYRDLFQRLQTLAAARSAVCFVDINCPEGAPYQDIKRSVVEVIAGGGQCSASLLNNTAWDATPYMLTANHCGDQTNGIQIFSYERTGCGTGSSSTSLTLSGTKKLASTALYDSQLYRLNTAPPQSFEPFYAGWDRRTSPAGPMIGIHHAQGMPKKISIDNGDSIVGNTFHTVDWDVGMVHGGSSGSPLFTGEKRVVGPACCVSSFECATQLTQYGRFDRFYNTRNLGKWLDPLDRDPQAMNGNDPFVALAVVYNGSGANPSVYTGIPPVLGTPWSASVDVTGHPGATGTVLLGRLDQSSGTFLSIGELLIDLSSEFLFELSSGVSGGTSDYVAEVPNDPALAGAIAYTQVAIFGGGVELTNGLKLRIY